MRVVSREKILKGWSVDQKYCITAENGQRYLLRISPHEQELGKRTEFLYMQKAFDQGVSMCQPLEFGVCDEGVYSIQSWVDGVDAEQHIPTIPPENQYTYGVFAGKQLAKIHKIQAPHDLPNWEVVFNKKIDRKLELYQNCPIKIENAHYLVEYVERHRHLLAGRPCVFQHGDFHIGNMMVDKDGKLMVIDFNRADFGDPYEEFNRLVWSAQACPFFATGIVDGYFDGNVPTEFWQLVALYIATNTISSVPWAIPFGQVEIDVMLNQARDVLQWYDNMKTCIPKWYKRP